MNKIKNILLCCILLCTHVQAQQFKRILFVGNSYVYTNNLPLMLSNLAAAHGDSVYYDSSTPGGYTFQLHCTNATTLAKIAQGNWNYVALQEQSQLPSFPPGQVAADCLPYAYTLDSLIHVASPCAESVFYMTWGRKNGDAANCASYPPLCTYAGMQDRLRDSYLLMGQQNNASVAPVGCAWREVRNQNPAFDLYVADESHPSVYGSYLAACIFYSTFFKKPVTSLLYTAGLPLTDAALIQQQCNLIMFDSLQTWFTNGNIPFATFAYQQNLTTYQFNNTSLNAASYLWNFGDGTTSVQTNPQHTYTTNGTYPVTLTAFTACDTSYATDTLMVSTVAMDELKNTQNLLLTYSNPILKVAGNGNNEKYTLYIYTADGKQVVKKSNFSCTCKIKLQQGVYVVSLQTKNKKSFTGKLLVDDNRSNTFSLLKP